MQNGVELLNGDKIEVVDKFCYLGDMIGLGGGVGKPRELELDVHGLNSGNFH